VISKLIVGRPKDRDFAAALIRDGLVDRGTLAVRLERTLGLDAITRDRVQAAVARLGSQAITRSSRLA